MGISPSHQYGIYANEDRNEGDYGMTLHQQVILNDLATKVTGGEKNLDVVKSQMEELNFAHIFERPDLRQRLAVVINVAQCCVGEVGAYVMDRLKWMLPPDCFAEEQWREKAYTPDEMHAYMLDDPQSNYCKLFPYNLVGELVEAHSNEWSSQMTNCIAALCSSTYAPALDMDAVIQSAVSFLSEVERTFQKSGANKDIIQILHDYAIRKPDYSWLADLHTTEIIHSRDIPKILRKIINDIPVNMRVLLTLDDRRRRLRCEFPDDRADRYGWQWENRDGVNYMQQCIGHLQTKVLAKLRHLRDANRLESTLSTWHKMYAAVLEKEEKSGAEDGEAAVNLSRDSFIGLTVYNAYDVPANMMLEGSWANYVENIGAPCDAHKGLMCHELVTSFTPLVLELPKDSAHCELIKNAIYKAQLESIEQVRAAASTIRDTRLAIQQSDEERRRYNEAEVARQEKPPMYEPSYQKALEDMMSKLML
jgi:hypothetical protein